ncbi:hypothetical protein [Saccharopolyspora sp. NPDC002578]|uniref:Uncharacterized protein n=1 Tax=Saccharopolyspora gloriosae TaxID=455344 RepID=A0A840NQE5_9PSEU|nr:hypothetical protein [Saccharopolyspora gloriosae]
MVVLLRWSLLSGVAADTTPTDNVAHLDGRDQGHAVSSYEPS